MSTVNPVGNDPGQPRDPGQRNRRIALILGLVAVLLVCCCAGALTGVLLFGDNIYDEVRERSRKSVGIDQPARDGQLEFRVRAIECGIESLGEPFLSHIPTGQYCLVQVAARNVGDRPALFDDSLQRAYGPNGKQFGTDTSAGLLVNSERPVFLSSINPGNQVTGLLVYDIAPDSRITRLELHESDGSRGVLVRTTG